MELGLALTLTELWVVGRSGDAGEVAVGAAADTVKIWVRKTLRVMTRIVEVVLVRHGESEWNAEHRFQGQQGTGLSAVGLAQAEAAAVSLQRLFADSTLAVSSDLQRVRETYLPWARATGRPIQIDPQWREIDVGAWGGLLVQQVRTRWPEQVQAMEQGDDVARGGGETFADLRERVWRAMTTLVESVADDGHDHTGSAPVIVFTHGGPIRVAATSALGLPPMGHRWLTAPHNCSFTLFRHQLTAGVLTASELVSYSNDAVQATSLSLFG